MAKVLHTCTGCVPIDVSIIDVYTQLIATSARAEAAADKAEEASLGKAPYIGENGNWWEWDEPNKTFVDTGIQAATGMIVDDQLSDTSEYPVQNKVVKSAIDEKQDALVSGTNIKTVNGESILGSGNITAGDPNAVKYTEQTLTSEQKAQARTNIGAGTSNFSGSYNDLSNKPVIPTVPTISTDISADATSDTKTASPKAVKTYVDAHSSPVIEEVTVSVSNTTGIPSGSGTFNDGTLALSLVNIKGETGSIGATPDFSIGTVQTGAAGSQASASISGTAETPVLSLVIPKGDQGNTGSSVDYPYELVNNLTTNDATKGLTAAMGVQLEGEVSQLEQKVDVTTVLKSLSYESRTKKKWIDTSGQINTGTSDAMVVDVYLVTPSASYFVNGRVGTGTNACLVAFYDQSGAFISGSAYYTGASPYNGVMVTAPVNAVSMAVAGNTSASYPYSPSATEFGTKTLDKVIAGATLPPASNAVYNDRANIAIITGKNIPFRHGAIKGLTGSTISYNENAARIQTDLPTENVSAVVIADEDYVISAAALYNDILPSSFVNLASYISSDGKTLDLEAVSVSGYNRIAIVIKKSDDSSLLSVSNIDEIVKIIPKSSQNEAQAVTKNFDLLAGALSVSTGYYSTVLGYDVNYSHTPKFIRISGEMVIKTRNLSGSVLYYNGSQAFISRTVFDTMGSDYTLSPPTNAALFRVTLNTTDGGIMPLGILVSGQWDADESEFQNRPSDSGYQHVTALVRIKSNAVPSDVVSEITEQYVMTTDSGILHLPSSYTKDGSPTPLIIFLHGSADKYSVSSTRFATNNPLAPEWDAAGYAQLDVDMVPDIYPQDVTNPSGTGDDYECVLAAYEWVIAHFNIARNGFYLIGRSRGAQAVLTILGKYDPIKFPVLCAISNDGANSIVDYVLFMESGTNARWQLFCDSHGLPSAGRPSYSSGYLLANSSIVQFLRDNIGIWWNKAMTGIRMLIDNPTEYQTPTDIFDLIVASYNAATQKGKDFCDFVRACKFRSPIPLRFDWCKQDTIQDWDAHSWGTYSSALKDAFVNNVFTGNAVYREWPTSPENPDKDPHFHEQLNFLDGDYKLPNGVVITDPSMARLEWLLWCQSHDHRYFGSIQPVGVE